MSKFAKKEGHLVLDMDAKGGPKFGKVGKPDGSPTKRNREILAKAGIKEGKKSKPAKAEKSKKAPKAERVSKEDTRTIKVLNKENPHREGSGRYKAFEAVKKAKKVSDYLESGSKPKYLSSWEDSKHIKIS